MDTLDILKEARKELCATTDEQEQFDNRFIGVLSALVPADLWQRAVERTKEVYLDLKGVNDGRVHASAA